MNLIFLVTIMLSTKKLFYVVTRPYFCIKSAFCAFNYLHILLDLIKIDNLRKHYFEFVNMADISKVRTLVRKSKIDEFYLTSAPLQEGCWLILFKYKDGNQDVLTKARSKDQKVYKDANTAIKALHDIGAENIETKLII